MTWIGRGFLFTGRITPGQYFFYWLLTVGIVIAAIVLLVLSLGFAPLDGLYLLGYFAAIWISLAWISLASLVKRFRDAQLSFWFFLLVFIPFGGLAVFIMALAASSKPVGAIQPATSPETA